ncbi:MAG: hypothetical protein O3A95_07785 [Planctomycetota bacterium]|nr:hypothetical protein [Planctomycetota bacterium]MDA1114182.1 hypothetical protein [Planctomycetota bacterium]
MFTVALLLCAPLAISNPQQPSAGFEKLTASLEQRTAARRVAAEKAWTEHGAAYLAQPARATMDPLLDFTPEIQEPLMKALEQSIRGELTQPDAQISILLLLARCLNSAGSAKLIALLPQLSLDQQAKTLRTVIEQGGPRTLSQARTYLDHSTPALRQAALEGLLLHLSPAEMPALIARFDYAHMDLEVFGAMLDSLAEREIPAEFQLPADTFQQSQRAFLAGAVNFLTQHPQDNAEDFLLDRVLDRRNAGLSMEAKTESLHAYEAGAQSFRWDTGVRTLARDLKEMPRTPFSMEVAWTLHRLGEKAGRSYLLELPEDIARRNPDDWRAQFSLAQLQVEVSEFSSAYRLYKKTLDSLEGTPAAKRVEKWDYFYAARAAAGSKHSKEAGQWLEASRLTPEKLAPFRDLPEFEPYLKKDPFKRLLTVAD